MREKNTANAIKSKTVQRKTGTTKSEMERAK